VAPGVSEIERHRWAGALSTAGWCCFVAYLLLVIAQFRRAFAIRTSSFPDGVWGQRAETISFVTYPQQVVILVPAVAAGIAAVLVGRTTGAGPGPWAAQLVRLAAGTCYVVIVLALLGIVDVLAQAPDAFASLFDILVRVAGVLIAAGLIRVSLEIERTARTD
jgi:hypothetical protein